MTAPVGYPVTCLSLYCGAIVCDGCENRPRLAAYYAERGRLADYEAHQAEARQTVARIERRDKESAAR